MWGAQELKREQMEEQRRAAAAARQELKEDKKPKQTAAGPAPSMALRTQASLQRALSNDDDGMFWDYGQAAGLRAGMGSCPVVIMPCGCSPAAPLCSFRSCCFLLCFLYFLLFSSVPLLRHDSLDDLVHLPGSLQLPLPPGNIELCCEEGTCCVPHGPPVPMYPPLEASLELWVLHMCIPWRLILDA